MGNRGETKRIAKTNYPKCSFYLKICQFVRIEDQLGRIHRILITYLALKQQKIMKAILSATLEGKILINGCHLLVEEKIPKNLLQDKGFKLLQQKKAKSQSIFQIFAQFFSEKAFENRQIDIQQNEIFRQQPSLIANNNPNFVSQNSDQKMMMQFMVEQMNTIEKTLQGEISKAMFLISAEKDGRHRIETNLRLQQEQKKMVQDDLQERIINLESRLAKEEGQKTEFISKWQKSEAALKQVQYMMRNFQNQESEELSQMRQMIQEKFTAEQTEVTKEREKSKALFFEVVRLGEQSERHNELIQNVNLGLESRIQTLESQLNVGNRAIQGLNQRGETGLGFLNEWNDKLEKRMQTLEANLYSVSVTFSSKLQFLKKTQLMDKDTISRVEKANTQITEDLKMLLESLSSDYETRLDKKVNDMVNKILIEHEERVKSQDELKNHVDFRDKVIQEKQQYEREEMRDRYMAMDSLVRAEFQRKDEAIKSLQGIFETQVRSLQTQIKQEETSRNQFEAVVRGDFARMQEALQKEYGFFKQQQVSLTEKITEMIKFEIDTRLSSDADLKNLTNMMATGLTSEITMFKENMEVQNKKFAQDLKQLSHDTAEKANQLSRYTDVSCKKVQILLTKKYDKLKGLFQKIAEQFKNHLIQYEKYRQDISSSLYNLEEAQGVLRKEFQEGLSETESKLYDHVKETKNLLENIVLSKTQVLEDNINKVKDQQTGDMEIFKKSLENTRETLIIKSEKLNEQNEQYHKNNYENMKQILKEIDEVNNSIRFLKENFRAQTTQIKQDIQTVKSEFSVQILNEKVIRDKGDTEIKDQLEKETTEMKNNVFNQNNKISSLRNTVDQNKERFKQKVVDCEDNISDIFNKTSSTLEIFAGFKKKYSSEMNSVNASISMNSVLTKNQSSQYKQMINQITELFEQSHSETNKKEKKFAELFVRLNKDVSKLSKKLEVEIDEVMDRKLQLVREQIKADQNATWKDSLNQVDQGFDKVGKIFCLLYQLWKICSNLAHCRQGINLTKLQDFKIFTKIQKLNLQVMMINDFERSLNFKLLQILIFSFFFNQRDCGWFSPHLFN